MRLMPPDWEPPIEYGTVDGKNVMVWVYPPEIGCTGYISSVLPDDEAHAYHERAWFRFNIWLALEYTRLGILTKERWKQIDQQLAEGNIDGTP